MLGDTYRGELERVAEACFAALKRLVGLAPALFGAPRLRLEGRSAASDQKDCRAQSREQKSRGAQRHHEYDALLLKQCVQLFARTGIDPVSLLFEPMECGQQIRMLRVSGIVAPLLQALAQCGGVAPERLRRCAL